MPDFSFKPISTLYNLSNASSDTLNVAREADETISETAAKFQGYHYSSERLTPGLLGGLQRAANALQGRFGSGDRQLLIEAGAIRPPSIPGQPSEFIDDRFFKAGSDLDAKQARGKSLSETDLSFRRYFNVRRGASHIQQISTQWTDVARKRAIKEVAIYRPEMNGEYPLRTTEGERLVIKRINLKSQKSESGERYDVSTVEPFLSDKLTKEERAALYEKLKCVVFEPRLVQRPSESKMIGVQNAVVASRPIKKGECLGVYGGTVIRGAQFDRLRDYTFIMSLQIEFGKEDVKDEECDYVDGDNILSRLNSTFDEKDGAPYRQAPNGYNVEPAAFKSMFEDGSERYLNALFATCDIDEDTELRWNYGYDDKTVVTMIGRP